MNSEEEDVYPEIPLDEPEPGRVARLLEVCLCPLWFVLDWFYTRNWWALAGALPALLAGAATWAVLMIGKSTPDEYWLRTYNRRAVDALSVEDTTAAEVYFRRMAMLNRSAPPTIYGLAVTAARRKDYDRARALMRRIAPEHAAGYPPAHFWLAKEILKENGRLAPGAEELLEHHLTQSLGDNDANWESHAILGQLYGARGDAKRAIPHLLQVSRQRPDLQLMLAILYEREKNTTAARASAKGARDFFREKAESDPKALEARIQWARCEVLLKNYDEAVRILQEGLTSSAPEGFHAALVEVYLRRYAAVPEAEPGSLVKRLELLNSALAHGPDNPHVLTLLADLSTRDWGRAGETSKLLQQVLARGTAPATVHAILGTRALQQGDLEKGRMHLELAYEGNRQMPAVLNNLAWALANAEKPDLQRALQLAQAANKLSNHPEISDTIGTILARMGRHREAVKELETALRAFPGRPDLHRKLAGLYETLGDAQLAKLHDQLAKQGKKTP